MTVILGISAFYHDSAAALVVDGEVVAAAQEERFSRIKHDESFPEKAIAYCLEHAKISIEQIDFVAFYEKPFKKFERIVETHLRFAPHGWNNFCQSMPVWLRSKLYLSRAIRKGLGGKYKKRIVFPEHHESHAASAFFPSPFEEAAILTVDGVGEWTTSSIGAGVGNRIQLQQELSFPDSLGLLYSTFTAFCGFRVNGGEGKLMGLASYGEPVYKKKILAEVVSLREDGSFRLNQKYFNYCNGSTMASPEFARLFGGPPRTPESEITQREKDLAASIQNVAEEILLRMCRHVYQTTGMKKNLCLAGGVALNCVANGRLLRDGPFENVWIQPAAGDAGGAVGAALFVWHQLLGKKRVPSKFASQYLGPEASGCTADQIQLPKSTVVEKLNSRQALADSVAGLLHEGQIVGWFQGRMEFGPRALGNRSILANPSHAGMKDKLNAKVKFRESFRPFAPVVLAERASEFFDLKIESPYMLLAANVIDSEAVPEVTHVDGTARVQTVTEDQNPALHQLLSAFDSHCGCPMLINTSFNVRGEPIVCNELDAIDCFLRTQMDALAIGTTLYKKQMPATDVSETSPELGFPRRPAERQLNRVAKQSETRSWFKVCMDAIHTVTFPLRWLLSRTVLTVVYFALIWPVGTIVRVTGRVDGNADSEATLWADRDSSPNPKQYFKQY